MTYELCKNIINAGFENNPFMTKELMQLQINFFKLAGEITEEQAIELSSLLNPVEVQPV